MTVRIPHAFMERLKWRLSSDNAKFQSKVMELLTEYVDSPRDESEEERRMPVAKEEMERFRDTFRILSR